MLGRLRWGAIGPSGVLHMLVVCGGNNLEVKIRTRAHMHLHRITVSVSKDSFSSKRLSLCNHRIGGMRFVEKWGKPIAHTPAERTDNWDLARARKHLNPSDEIFNSVCRLFIVHS